MTVRKLARVCAGTMWVGPTAVKINLGSLLQKAAPVFGLLVEPSTNITIVVGKRDLSPLSRLELMDFCKRL